MAAFEAQDYRPSPLSGLSGQRLWLMVRFLGGVFLARDEECLVIDGQSRVERCPWSVVDARNSAKVEDRVRLPARALNCLTLKSHGVAAACKAASSGFDSHRRLFGLKALMSSVQRRSGHSKGFCSDCSEHGF